LKYYVVSIIYDIIIIYFYYELSTEKKKMDPAVCVSKTHTNTR